MAILILKVAGETGNKSIRSFHRWTGASAHRTMILNKNGSLVPKTKTYSELQHKETGFF